MKYERFTERVGKGIAIKETSTNDNRSIWNAIEYLAEIEDKIEQGTLIELPCKVGDTVYYVHEFDEVILEGVVEIISFSRGYKRDFSIINPDARICLDDIGEEWFSKDNFGETLFLTREEAEKRLEELKGGK